uniref:Translocation and assembly module TamB n=1 Tax=Candidatus Kentrum eta TaxID=2126337 RepID=A0A450UTN9_9GAMM|nr:MAG: translocation and assembly module TamB [Candidatus Kentron sp. H]VFJ89310.1 MAG: translocation and assembly module TamB [Candidatus Kentron sp. H]VFJ95897.1 MAG: translocation and assembly module TamB [Candidatus Kentron sp. H]
MILSGVIYLLILPVTIISLMAFGLGATEPGTRWAVRHALPAISAMATGDRLRIRASEGTLLSSLTLTGIAYHPTQSSNAPTTLESVSLQWRPRALFSGLLHIHRLRISGLYHELGPALPGKDGHGASDPIPRLPLPPALQLEQLEIAHVHMVNGTNHYRVQRLAAGPITFAGGAAPLVIEALQIEAEPIALALALEIDPVAPFAYKARGSGRITGADGTPWVCEGNLHGDASGTVVERLEARLPDSRMEARGSVDWSPKTQWDLTLSAQGIDPGIYRWVLQPDLQPAPKDEPKHDRTENDWHGALDLAARVHGRLDTDALALGLEIKRLEGVLRGYPVAASGRMALVGNRIEVRGLTLRSGDNRWEANGDAPLPDALLEWLPVTSSPPVSSSKERDSELDLSFTLDAPTLDALWPGLAGRLHGTGRLEGDLADPAMHLRMTGKGISYRDYKAATLRAKLALYPDGSSGPSAEASHVDVAAGDVVLAGEKFSRLWAQGKGRLALEDITLGMDFSRESGTDRERGNRRGKVAIALAGGLKAGVWSGTLKRADMALPWLGEWTLAKPVPLRLGIEGMDMGGLSPTTDARACWQRQKARLCLGGGGSKAAGFRVKGHMTGLPWPVLRPWLPAALEVQGAIAADFDIQGSGNGQALQADLAVTPGPGALIYRMPGRGPLKTPFRDARLRASYAKDRLRATLGLHVAGGGTVAGELQVGPGGAERPLRGALEAELPDLAPLAGFIPQADNLAGALALAFTLGGTAQAPALHGRATLTGGAADLPAAGIRLREIALVAESRGGNRTRGERVLDITGAAQSGPGEIAFTGALRQPFGPTPRLELAARGERFQALRLPEAQVFVSPDLHVTWDRRGTLVDGTLSIPEARLALEGLPESGIAVSEDEVVLGKTGADASGAGPGHAVGARVSVVLGEKVSFSGFGLSAGLAGSIALDSRPGQPTLANGAITLKDGQYRAYGQTLAIERGRLVFAGPADNPALEARAARQVAEAEVTVGVHITGTLKRPLVSLGSDPDMPETEILAYLLTGKSLADTPRTDQAALLDAAMGLMTSQSQSFTGRLGKKIGLDTVKVQGGENALAESTLLLGKYLTPRLYVGYVQGIFENTRAFQAEYRLTDSLSIKTRSSDEAQGAEVVYTIERD